MCGIFGYAGRPKEGMQEAFRTFMDALALATEHRGRHATGIAAYVRDNRGLVAKGPVPARAFIKTPAWEKGLKARALIGHCRYATAGSPSRNENNHPFESGKWALIHNGIVMGHHAIAHQYGVRLKTECDSEIILRLFAEGARDRGPLAGLQKFVDAIKDRMADYAIALLDRSNGKIRLLRDDGRPCAIVKLPALGIVAFASTPEILKEAMEAAQKEAPDVLDGAEGWNCDRDKVYVLTPGTMEVSHETINVPKPTAPPNYVGRIRDEDTIHHDGDDDEPARPYGIPNACPMCGKYVCQCEELTAPE